MTRVSTSGFYDRAARQMGALSARADTLQTKIATGKRLQAPSDDALAYRRLGGLARQEADASAYAGNLKLAGGVLAQADTAVAAVGDQLQRASELALQAANGTLSDDNRRVIAVELRGVAETLAALANTTDARGEPLFGGADGSPAATKRADGGYDFAMLAPSAVPIGEGQSVAASEAAARVFGMRGRDGPTDMIAVVAGLAAALEAGGDVRAATGAAIDDLKVATDQAASVQASIGARAARVELAQAQMLDQAVDREAVRSDLEDADVTAAITELQKTMTVLQATQASFSKLQGLSLFDYLR